MTNDMKPGSQLGRFARPAAMIGAGLVAGVVAASTMTASAQTATPTPSTSAPAATSSSSAAATPSASKAPDSPTPVREDETLLTGTNAEKAKAAALKAVPGGTIIRLETDSGPAEFEAHMKKADGTRVTVLMDANFAVTSIEEHMGRGGRGGGGCKDGDGSAPAATTSGTSA